MGLRVGVLLLFTVGLAFSTRVVAAEPSAENAVKELKSDSRAPYVHRLTLYDHDGKAIDPKDPLAGPYSPRMTCGKCHAYAETAGGWHFSAARADVPPGRPGEPWWLVDLPTGTILPLSGRAWPGTYRPADAGLSDWQFVKRFGHHLPGGGYGEPDEAAVKASAERLRWSVSGPLEIDCMFCHATGQEHDPAEAARQIEAENFRWAPTAALALAVVRGEARKAPDDWERDMPPDPDHPERAGPKLVWDKSRFDPDDRVLFNITRRIPNERCFFCHTSREVGPDKPDDLVTSRDVHLAAGLLCVDCHREELVHLTTRGYATEAAERKADCLATFSCEGCHLGTDARAGEEEKDAATAAPPAEEAADAAVRLGGRYGAPHPQHRGLPLVHFEKLTCTACHSGPWPETDAKQFQTAMAHGLGLATRDREDTDPPLIVGPIFAKQPDGKVAPQRMVWPAFWGRLAGDGVTPIPLDVVRKLASKGLPKTTGKVTTRPTRLSTDQIARILESLAAQKDGAGTPVYVQDGRLYRRAADGKLEFVASTAAAPVRWSLAHDVRPASESLGIRGCNDCHANDAPLFFGRVAMAGQTGVPTSQPMVVFRGDEEGIARAWALGFIVRPEFKVLGFLCAALITLLVLRYGTQGFRGESDARRGFTRYEHFLHLLVVVGVLIQAITGFVGKYIVGELDEWLLFVHMLGAPLFIVGLTGSALHWSPRCRFTPAGRVSISGLSPSQKFLFWVTLVVGLLTMLPMLAAMVPLFGYADQETLTAIHADAALALVLVMAVLIMTSIRPTRLPKEVKQP